MATQEVEIDQVKFGLIKDEITANLPSSWIASTLGESFKWGSGGTPRSGVHEYYAGGNIPWLIIGDLNDAVVNASQTAITDQGLKDSSAKLVEPGTILMAMYGSIGKLGIAGKALATNQAIAFAYKNEIDPMYLFYFLMRIRGRLITLGKGATQLNISQTVIKAFPFVIAPLNEQHRIVQKIEELFSELDKGIENLKLAQDQLKIYRQALLRDAFVGKLTTQWRKNNVEMLESAETLLERIQFQREKNYQEQITSWETLGKKGTKPKPPKLLSELSPEEFVNLPKLASGWTWVKLGDVADLRGGITKGKNLDGKPTATLPYLRVANVQDGYLNLNLIKQIAVFVEEENKYKLQKGDVLYTEGGDKDKLGRGAVWNCEIDDCIHQNHIFRARIVGEVYMPDLLATFSRTQEAKNYFFKHAKQTTNLASINLGVLTNLPIPICCANEQKEVLSILKSTFAVAESIEKELNDSIKRSELLRQSILQKAFSGQLLPQDPNDESANNLLARIKAEITKSKTIKKKKAA